MRKVSIEKLEVRNVKQSCPDLSIQTFDVVVLIPMMWKSQ